MTRKVSHRLQSSECEPLWRRLQGEFQSGSDSSRPRLLPSVTGGMREKLLHPFPTAPGGLSAEDIKELLLPGAWRVVITRL
ncbi:hypothetical protein EYF80_067085 [Liparis tanakae]|uniref:Uncharacterized protein n=1 Tax=Liparis tanakae TaxID=230148 RepID=A0A4Z2E204_9TELE|nr:hypothetical protein EYF80_067085 [Liparis tanakae]